ncbi:MAG: hypothetical protein U1A27_10410 [Phycisphaerae bacterium]
MMSVPATTRRAAAARPIARACIRCRRTARTATTLLLALTGALLPTIAAAADWLTITPRLVVAGDTPLSDRDPRAIHLLTRAGQPTACEVDLVAGKDRVRDLRATVQWTAPPAAPVPGCQLFVERDVTLAAPADWYLRAHGPAADVTVPDLLVPIDAPRLGLPTSLPPGTSLRLWLDVDACVPPGDYRARLALSAAGRATLERDLLLEVRPAAGGGHRPRVLAGLDATNDLAGAAPNEATIRAALQLLDAHGVTARLLDRPADASAGTTLAWIWPPLDLPPDPAHGARPITLPPDSPGRVPAAADAFARALTRQLGRADPGTLFDPARRLRIADPPSACRVRRPRRRCTPPHRASRSSRVCRPARCANSAGPISAALPDLRADIAAAPPARCGHRALARLRRDGRQTWFVPDEPPSASLALAADPARAPVAPGRRGCRTLPSGCRPFAQSIAAAAEPLRINSATAAGAPLLRRARRQQQPPPRPPQVAAPGAGRVCPARQRLADAGHAQTAASSARAWCRPAAPICISPAASTPIRPASSSMSALERSPRANHQQLAPALGPPPGDPRRGAPAKSGRRLFDAARDAVAWVERGDVIAIADAAAPPSRSSSACAIRAPRPRRLRITPPGAGRPSNAACRPASSARRSLTFTIALRPVRPRRPCPPRLAAVELVPGTHPRRAPSVTLPAFAALVEVPRAIRPLTADGDLSDWTALPRNTAGEFRLPADAAFARLGAAGDTPPADPLVADDTLAFFQYTDDALWVGLHCRATGPLSGPARRTDRLERRTAGADPPPAATSDCVELLLCTRGPRTGDPATCRIRVGPDTPARLLFGGEPPPVAVENPGTAAVAHASAGLWTAELVIPWQALGGRPAAGQPFALNLRRFGRAGRLAPAWSVGRDTLGLRLSGQACLMPASPPP